MSANERRLAAAPPESSSQTTEDSVTAGADSDFAGADRSTGQVHRLRPPLLARHREMLEKAGVPSEFAAARGVRSVTSQEDLPEELSMHAGGLPGLVFEWRDAVGNTHHQLRPDSPVPDSEGRLRKYLQGPGVHLLTVMGDPDLAREVWIVEGTKQALAAGAHAEPAVLVVGIPGCWNGMVDGQVLPELATLVEDMPVVVFFDADLATNAHVWQAAERLRDALELEGASSVLFARMPGGGSRGLDDLLGTRPNEKGRFLGRLAAKAKPLPKDPPPTRPDHRGGTDRPALDITQDRLDVIRETTDAMLARWDGRRLFNHGEVISELKGDRTVALDHGLLRLVLAETAYFYRPTRYDVAAAWPDGNVIASIAAQADRFTRLDRVTRVPFIRQDGTICQSPGYDEQSRTFLALDAALADVSVPESPTQEEIAAATSLLLDEWLGDMPLAEQADRANLLALIVTPFVRGRTPVVPMAVVDGLMMGVGKNLLADCLALLVNGVNADPLPFPGDDVELGKVITSTFGTGAELFVFDEAHSINGRSLARALTATTWNDRILGVSRMARYPNAITWIALGNQVQVHGDLVRRVYRIALRPTGPNPDQRQSSQFRHPDLREWTRAHRGELVQAALTLVRAWVAAAQPPPPSGVSFGSFERWEATIGGILHVAGVEGFLSNTQQWRAEADFESGYWEDHLDDLRCSFGEDPFTVAEVVDAVRSDLIVEMPPDVKDPKAPGFARELGKKYARVKGRWFGKYRIQVAGKAGDGGGRGRVNKWRVEVLDDTPALEEPPQPSVALALGEGSSGQACGNGLKTELGRSVPDDAVHRAEGWGGWEGSLPSSSSSEGQSGPTHGPDRKEPVQVNDRRNRPDPLPSLRSPRTAQPCLHG